MKGFPRRGSDLRRPPGYCPGRPCLNEGLPQKGKRLEYDMQLTDVVTRPQ